MAWLRHLRTHGSLPRPRAPRPAVTTLRPRLRAPCSDQTGLPDDVSPCVSHSRPPRPLASLAHAHTPRGSGIVEANAPFAVAIGDLDAEAAQLRLQLVGHLAKAWRAL
eukprot:599003-Prymnesium_polylepis.1